MSAVEILISLGSIATFVVFGIAVWVLKNERDKAAAKQQDHEESDRPT